MRQYGTVIRWTPLLGTRQQASSSQKGRAKKAPEHLFDWTAVSNTPIDVGTAPLGFNCSRYYGCQFHRSTFFEQVLPVEQIGHWLVQIVVFASDVRIML